MIQPFGFKTTELVLQQGQLVFQLERLGSQLGSLLEFQQEQLVFQLERLQQEEQSFLVLVLVLVLL